ncbi:MAG: SufD family Fe-S cluster assembly protein [Alphaproteobacteria bacterium]
MAHPKLTILKSDSLPWEDRAARVLGVASLPPLPTPRDEEWQATNLRPLMALPPHRDADWELASVAKALPVVQGPQLVLVNGRVVPQLSLLEGLHGISMLTDTSPSLPSHDALDVYNNHQGGQMASVTVEGTASTLHVIHVLAGNEVPTGGSLWVNIYPNSSLTLIEHVVSTPAAAGWMNDQTHIHVAEHSTLHHVVIQNVSSHSVVTRKQHVDVASTATYTAFTLHTGGTLARLETHLNAHAASHVAITGLSLTDAAQTHDTTLRIRHHDVGTQTRIRHRSILRGSTAHAVFQGKFYVAQKAQKTNANMLAESLLLADGARARVKPELEIYADDVICSHGASTGSLNPDQVFYMAARGIPETEAKRLLVSAFAEAVLDDVPAPAHSLVAAHVNAWLDGPTPAPDADAEPDTDWLS